MGERVGERVGGARAREGRVQRLLVVLPSWIGDAAMATPALRLLRDCLPGALVGGLARPGVDELLAGTGLLDEVHVDRARGMMGPRRVASRLRPMRYDTALLLTNSFSSALIAQLAWIPRRVGYDRDARGLLLTDRLPVPGRRGMGRGFEPVAAVRYYLEAARALLGDAAMDREDPPMELAVTEEQCEEASSLLERGGVDRGRALVVLNPGGNKAEKRWPADRFVEVGARLICGHSAAVVVNGSPGEAGLTAGIAAGVRARVGEAGEGAVADLAGLGVTIGSLKGVLRSAALLVTNDTGPRHIAAALGTPTVSLFGPTDPRWTALPARESAREVVLVADRTLPVEEQADDHPERCRIDRIGLEDVMGAAEGLLGPGRGRS